MFLENRVMEQNKTKLLHSHSKKGRNGYFKNLWVCSLESALGEKKCENVLCLSSLLTFKNSDMKLYKQSPSLPYLNLKMHNRPLELVANGGSQIPAQLI